MLLEQCDDANKEGLLTKPMLDNAIYETMAYKEPAASDIRNQLIGLRPIDTPEEEIQLRLSQARRILDLTADY